MIRHIMLMKFKPGVSAADHERCLAAGQELPARIDALRAFTVGDDVARTPRSYDLAIVADLDSLDDLRRYQQDPAHRAFTTLVDPLAAHIVVADVDIA